MTRGVFLSPARTGRAIAVPVDRGSMPTCSDCANYTAKGKDSGECRMAGPVPADRDTDRCPVRLFVPKPSR